MNEPNLSISISEEQLKEMLLFFKQNQIGSNAAILETITDLQKRVEDLEDKLK